MLLHDVHRNSNRKKSHRLRPLATLVSLFVLGLALLYLTREPLLIAAARALTIDDAEPPADYLVVLGGGAETRPSAAAALYRRGFAPKVLIFEHKPGRIIDLGLVPAHSELYRKILELEGVPLQAIVKLPGWVESSWDEALSLRRFLVSHSAQRIIVVTSAEHTRRARWVFRKVLANLPVDVRIAAARHLSFDETNWWKHDQGALIYAHEFLKLPFYWLRYLLIPPPARQNPAIPVPIKEREA